jgi:colanic acid/amylovoran biosynthesis glycosyltransferase
MVLAEGPHMAQLLMQMGCPENKVRVHHLGVTIDRLPFIPRQKQKQAPFRVLIAGSFREKKGITYAIEALGHLACDIPLQITLVGDASAIERSRREKVRILTAIDRYGLNGKVRMTGFLSHEMLLKEAYRHHVFLSPSVTSNDGDIEGGAPVAIIEMAATGMVVVSSRHCDIPQIIKHEVSGLLADERDVDGLVEHLRKLNDNPDCWPDMAKTARSLIESEYNARVQGVRLADIYKQLVAG